MLISLIPHEKAFASHIDQRKFAVLDEHSYTEVKGIIAEADETNGDIFLLPDPNYYNLLLEGNKVASNPSDRNDAGSTYPRWKEFQDELEFKCNVPVERKPYPIMRLELYGFDGYNAGPNAPSQYPFLPIVNDGVENRTVRNCDHISLRGLYVIDHGHTMYQDDGMTPAFCYNIRIEYPNVPDIYQRVCKPHAEMHPYQWQSVRLVKSWPGSTFTPNVENHTMVIPFYREFFGERRVDPLPWWECKYPPEGICNQVVDVSRQNQSSFEWFIDAGPYPGGGQCGPRAGDRCEIKYQYEELINTGQVSTQIIPESNGIRVQVSATALPGSDYSPLPPTGQPGSYKLVSPSKYIAKYSVWWVPAGPPPPPQEQLPK